MSWSDAIKRNEAALNELGTGLDGVGLAIRKQFCREGGEGVAMGSNDAILRICDVLNRASEVPAGTDLFPLAQEVYRTVENDVALDVSSAVNSIIRMFDGSDQYSDTSTEEMIRDWAKARGVEVESTHD